MNSVPCATCGTPIYMDKAVEEARRGDEQPFCCINGHSNVFGESPEKKRIKKLEAEITFSRDRIRELRAENSHQQKQIAGLYGQLARQRNRLTAKLDYANEALEFYSAPEATEVDPGKIARDTLSLMSDIK
jgi:hypothetical protein